MDRATGFCDVELAARVAFPPRGGAPAWPAAATVQSARATGAAVVRTGRSVAGVPPGAPDREARGEELEQPARERSRGLDRPLRHGAPVRLPRDRGSFPSLGTEAERASAIAELHGDVYAPSSRDSLAFKWRTVQRAFDAWGADPFPPSVTKVTMLAAALKAGRYRSAPGYLSLYRTSSARLGHTIGPELVTAFRDAARSCGRGLGAPVRASPLPLLRLHALRDSRSPWTPGGPCCPRNAVVAGAWWMLREIELATARARLVTTGRAATGERQVFLTLPASKSDQAAHGVARGHRCRCSALPSRVGCPACCILDQMSFLKRQFPGRWADGRPCWSLPLFPRLDGQAVAKEAFVATIVEAATQLEVPLVDADASSRISGHSLRVTGAQGLTRLGFPLWAVQLLGRWGSDTVKSYVGTAALDIFTETGPDDPAPNRLDLDAAVAAARGLTEHRPTDADGRAAPADPAELRAAVSQQMGDLRAELFDALMAEVRLEVARRLAPARTSRDSSSSTGAQMVQNLRTKCIHFCAVSPDSGLPPSEWTSLCSWDFGRWGGFALVGGPPSRATCERCITFAQGRIPADQL